MGWNIQPGNIIEIRPRKGVWISPEVKLEYNPIFHIGRVYREVTNIDFSQFVPDRILESCGIISIHIDLLLDFRIDMYGLPPRTTRIWADNKLIPIRTLANFCLNKAITWRRHERIDHIIRKSTKAMNLWEIVPDSLPFWNNHRAVLVLVQAFMCYIGKIPDGYLLKITTNRRTLPYLIDQLLKYEWFQEKLQEKMPGQMYINLAGEIAVTHQDKKIRDLMIPYAMGSHYALLHWLRTDRPAVNSEVGPGLGGNRV